MKKLCESSLLSGQFGLEKENVRVDKAGVLSKQKHPTIFGNEHPFVSKDFGEAQVEMITPPLPTIKAAWNYLYEIEKKVNEVLHDEVLWPQSNPPRLPDEREILIAQGNEKILEAYKAYLADYYGAKKAIISGIHFNLSFSSTFLMDMYKQEDIQFPFTIYEEQVYLKVMKYFMKYRWLFMYVLNASPIFDASYDHIDEAEVNTKGDCFIKGMTSLRNSVYGYRNKQRIVLDYHSLQAYKASMQQYVDQGVLKRTSEVYTAIRLRTGKDTLYLEMRFLDINPLCIGGMDPQDLEMLHMFAVFFASLEDFDFTEETQWIAWENQNRIAIIESETPIFEDGQYLTIREASEPWLDHIAAFYQQYEDLSYDTSKIIKRMYEKVSDYKETYAYRIDKLIKQSDYLTFHLKQADVFKKQMEETPFTFKGYEAMELSTQILMQACLMNGYMFEVLDEKDNFIRIVNPKNNHAEYIKNATKTSKDKYSQVLLMENKQISKRVLQEHGIKVPEGEIVHDVKRAEQLYDAHKLPAKLVVKPNTTNFGAGITILNYGYTKEMYMEAVKLALSKDRTVLLEAFIKGKEYRFLVIGNHVAGVLHRRPASVVGDGIHTIKALVDIKNQSYLRGVGYHTPLEKIVLNDSAILQLKQYDMDITSIPKKDERVYVRENSNISTGGDSMDVSEEMHESYKKIALRVCQALDVTISGIDMMVEDIYTPASSDNYGVIEANFNPAIHIHCYPYQGMQRDIGGAVLRLLFDEEVQNECI